MLLEQADNRNDNEPENDAPGDDQYLEDDEESDDEDDDDDDEYSGGPSSSTSRTRDRAVKSSFPSLSPGLSTSRKFTKRQQETTSLACV